MARVKKKDHENLSDNNIRKVITLLSSSPAITKKQACEILNIAYNTTRLNRIIEAFEEQQDLAKRMKAKKRGQPASKDEMRYIIEAYMEGVSITNIAKANYRSNAFVKSLIAKVGVPTRAVGEEKHSVEYLPDECVSEEFAVGEVVWSAYYHKPGKILKRLDDNKYIPKYGTPCYDVYIFEETEGYTKGGFYASSAAYDLGKLSHLEEYGVTLGS